MNAAEDRWKPMKTDETVEQEQLGSCQLFADEETGHGTIPLLAEGVAAGRGSDAPAARRAVEKTHRRAAKKDTPQGIPASQFHSFLCLVHNISDQFVVKSVTNS